MISTNVVDVKAGSLADVSNFISQITGVDVHSADSEGNRILITIDSSSDSSLEEISRAIQQHPAVIALSHHSFYFDEDAVDTPLEQLISKKRKNVD